MVCHAAGFPAHSLWISLIGWKKKATLLQPNPKDQERDSMRRPASREIISDSVELCETEVCFLHIQLLGTCDLQICTKIHPEVDFESSTLQQSQSPETVPTCIVVQCFLT